MVNKKKEAGARAEKKITTTKVDAQLNTQANMVAIYRGMSLQAYIDGILRPVVEKDFRAMGEEISGK